MSWISFERLIQLLPAKQHLNVNVDVLRNFAQQNGRNILAFVKRYCSGASIAVPELFVRAFLARLKEAELLQMAHNLMRFKNRQATHFLSDCDLLSAYKLGLEMWLAIVEQHRHNLLKILI